MGFDPDKLQTLRCSESEQQTLIQLARQAILEAIEVRGMPGESPEPLTPTLLQHAASFVTLTLSGKLRGCVGNLVAKEPVYCSIMHNAIGAALRDTRFHPVSLEESSQLAVHISILSPLVRLSFKTSQELLDQLTPGEVGVVLKHSGRTSTYLPQVWESLKEKSTFLNSLCRKAGLDSEAWKQPEIEVFVYRVSEFGDV